MEANPILEVLMEQNKKIAVTTDTNSGLMPHELDDKGIFVLPMPFVIDNECFLESVDLSRADFYEKLKGDAKITTAQPSAEEVKEFWTEILKDYDEIVHIPTSSFLSGACETAKALSEEFQGKVHVVDNHRISAPLKWSALNAAHLREQGKTAEEIVAILTEQSADYSIYLSLESMEYLKKGGRISSAVAAIGSILKLRPVLQIKGAGIEKHALPRTQAKAQMIMKDALLADLEEKFKPYAEKGELRLIVVYGEHEQEALELENEVKKYFPNIPFLPPNPMSLSVACHTGPNTIAICLIRVNK